MMKETILFLGIIVLIALSLNVYADILAVDLFDRPDSNTVGGLWIENEVSATDFTIRNNQLNISVQPSTTWIYHDNDTIESIGAYTIWLNMSISAVPTPTESWALFGDNGDSRRFQIRNQGADIYISNPTWTDMGVDLITDGTWQLLNLTMDGSNVVLCIDTSCSSTFVGEAAQANVVMRLWRYPSHHWIYDGYCITNGTSTYSDCFPPVDSCTAPGSGDWEVDCSDNCNFDSNQDVPANMIITGSGTLTLSSSLTFTGSNQYISIGSGCTFVIESGGKIQ